MRGSVVPAPPRGACVGRKERSEGTLSSLSLSSVSLPLQVHNTSFIGNARGAGHGQAYTHAQWQKPLHAHVTNTHAPIPYFMDFSQPHNHPPPPPRLFGLSGNSTRHALLRRRAGVSKDGQRETRGGGAPKHARPWGAGPRTQVPCLFTPMVPKLTRVLGRGWGWGSHKKKNTHHTEGEKDHRG